MQSGLALDGRRVPRRFPRVFPLRSGGDSSLEVCGQAAFKRFAMGGRQKVDLHVIADESLQRDPAGAHAEAVAKLLGNDNLSLWSD